MNHGEKERKKDKWSGDRVKPPDFINKSLREKKWSKSINQQRRWRILEYYRVFAKQRKPLPLGALVIKFLPAIRKTKKMVANICF